MEEEKLSRRNFLRMSALAAAGAALASCAPAKPTPTEVATPAPVDASHSPHAYWRTLPMGDVLLTAGFWAERQAVNRCVTLRHGYEMLEDAGNFHNLRLAAGRKEGGYRGRDWNFLDSDVYKWLEAIAYELAREPDETLQKMADEAIDLIAAAQAGDGYLDSYYQVVAPNKRWTDLDLGHELYCAGHLFQAAVAYHRATGDTRLLSVATRFADHIDSVFGADKRPGAPGHPEIEMALVELCRDTGERRYLDLARFFIDQRGRGVMRGLWPGVPPGSRSSSGGLGTGRSRRARDVPDVRCNGYLP